MSFKNTDIGKIPVEWDVKTIQEIGEVISGGTPKTKEDSYWDGNVSWITPKDLSSFTERYIKEGERSITEAGLKNSSAKLLPKGTVLFSSRAPIGYIAIANKELCTNQGFKNIVCDKKYSSNEFVYYMLKAKKNEIESIAGGSTFKEVSGKVVKEFKIPIPPLEEQKAIAHILSTLDDKIEVNNQINKTLENMAQEIFKQWFVNFEFPNEDGEPYKSSCGEMVESELGMIPKGWKVKKVEDVTKIIRGASPRPIQDFIRDEGIPWVKISDASSSNTRFISSTKEFIKEEGRNKSREVQVGTLILSNSATPGIPMIMKIDACVHDGWLIFNEFRDVTKEYMFHFLTENRVGILSLSNGSVFRNLKTDILKNYKIIVPSSDVVAKIDDIFKSINNSIDYIENQIKTLTKIRDALLPKLMSGEIRVPLDEEGDVS